MDSTTILTKESSDNLSLKELKTSINRYLYDGNQDSQPFCVAMWNINTINDKKFNELKILINELSKNEMSRKNPLIDLIVLIEMGKQESKFKCYNIKNYKLYTALRSNRKGGGIAAYVHNSYASVVQHIEITTNYEIMSLKVFISEIIIKEYLIIYRPPSADVNSFLDMLEQKLSSETQNLVILGDININTSDRNKSPICRKYIELIESYGMKIFNNAITRFNLLTGNHSILDHFIAPINDNLRVFTSNNNLLNNCSDHNFLLALNPGNIERLMRINYVSIDRTNKDRMMKSIRLKLENFNVSESENVEIKCNKILQLVWDSHDENTSTFTIKTRNSNDILPPWTNKIYVTICASIHNLNEKIHKLEKSKRPTNVLKQKRDFLLNSKSDYAMSRTRAYFNDISLLNQKAGWNILNDNTGCERKRKSKFFLETGAKRITSDSEIAEEFQNYFLSIVGGAKVSLTPSFISNPQVPAFEFKKIDSIQLTMQQMDIGKASGYDGISPFIWNKLNPELHTYVTELFNGIVSEQIYPSSLKKTLVHPILKSGSSTVKENYRPISVPVSLNKIIETEIIKQIDMYMSENNLWDPMQYGFKKNKGCPEAISKVINTVSQSLSRNSSVLLISLDLSKAFDTINHDILIYKLQMLGFKDSAISLMRSYLNERIQIVKINQALSQEGKINQGIPQGTCVGPNLFNIYTNDMKDLKINASNFRFADDSILCWTLEADMSNSDDKTNVESDLQVISAYYEANSLKLNLSKSRYMILGSDDQSGCIQELMESLSIKKVIELKYLGVPIDKNLQFTCYTDQIRKKISQTTGALCTLKRRLNNHLLMNFYYANFQSHISYCAFLILRCTIQSINALQVLQNRSLKIIHGLPHDFSTKELYTKICPKILPVMGLLIYNCLVLVIKSLLSDDKSIVCFERLKSDRLKNIRTIITDSKYMKYDLAVIGASLYNSLPIELKSIVTITSFKVKVKKFLLQKNESLVSRKQMSERKIII